MPRWLSCFKIPLVRKTLILPLRGSKVRSTLHHMPVSDSTLFHSKIRICCLHKALKQETKIQGSHHVGKHFVQLGKKSLSHLVQIYVFKNKKVRLATGLALPFPLGNTANSQTEAAWQAGGENRKRAEMAEYLLQMQPFFMLMNLNHFLTDPDFFKYIFVDMLQGISLKQHR